MATLGPASALHVTGACVAVREGQGEGEAVLTLSRAVEVHNLFDHRCVHSWPVGSTDHVTCPAHFHKAMGRYCAVRNGNELLLWSSTDKSLPSHYCSLPSSPLSLLPTPLTHHIITVDTAGTVAMAAVESGEVKVKSELVIGGRQTRGKQLQVLYSRVCEVGGRESVVVMCAGGEVWVCAIGEEGLSTTARLQLGTTVAGQLVTCCGETLLAGGAAGCVCSLDLSNSPSTPHTLIPSLSPPPCLIAGVSSNYFAVLQPGGVVSLRDTKYGTSQASMETGLHSVATAECVSGHLVMCDGEGVSVCRVSVAGRASLAAALDRKTTPPQEALLVTPQWVEPCQDCVDWTSEVTASCLEERCRVQQLCEPSKTPSLEAVMALLPSPLPLHSLTYSPVARRLITEQQFWAHAALAELVKSGAVPGSLAGELVARAVEHGDWTLVLLALRSSLDVPEDILVRLLQHALQLPEVVESYGETLGRDTILWAALAVPYNDSLLQQPLSQLTLSTVLSLLQFLVPHVAVASLTSPPPVPYPCLLDWLAVLLDTHWTALTLSPLGKGILRDFHHSTYQQMLFCENMSVVQSVMEAVRSPRLRQPHSQWTHRVERMDLKI